MSDDIPHSSPMSVRYMISPAANGLGISAMRSATSTLPAEIVAPVSRRPTPIEKVTTHGQISHSKW